MISKYLSVACLLMLLTVSCSKKTSSRIPRPTYNVNIISDIEYGRNTTWLGSNQVLKLDVYAPKDASAQHKYPLLLLAHGGGFVGGTKEGLSDLCQALASKGFIAVSTEYRLGWNVDGADQCKGDSISLTEEVYRAMQDYNASLRFLVANSDKYFIDTNWIFTGGNSAGAVAALNSAYITDEFADSRYSDIRSRLGGLHDADNNLTNTYTIKGISSMWGGIFDLNNITAANGIPTIAFHGSEDQTIPVTTGTYGQCPNYQTLYGSLAIYNKLRGYNISAVAHIYEGEGHGPTEYADNPEYVATMVNCFFEGLRNKVPEAGLYKNMQSNCN